MHMFTTHYKTSNSTSSQPEAAGSRAPKHPNFRQVHCTPEDFHLNTQRWTLDESGPQQVHESDRFSRTIVANVTYTHKPIPQTRDQMARNRLPAIPQSGIPVARSNPLVLPPILPVQLRPPRAVLPPIRRAIPEIIHQPTPLPHPSRTAPSFLEPIPKLQTPPSAEPDHEFMMAALKRAQAKCDATQQRKAAERAARFRCNCDWCGKELVRKGIPSHKIKHCPERHFHLQEQ
ncbi:hypothetical protein E1B28_011930 [Marasmius oreades]|uniref:Uncharacterized protein n=1 Tax=Marasmius oreades TaxID=181124 RepID=A0A9P7RRS3_9AGAR|nr:uncharacterized protein E1B28_011930 [Marasmius oreades]KAG7087883.1 hypothetical protein E1B28_011930 [Marasmius oreades]